MGLPGVQNANNVCIGSLILNFCLYLNSACAYFSSWTTYLFTFYFTYSDGQITIKTQIKEKLSNVYIYLFKDAYKTRPCSLRSTGSVMEKSNPDSLLVEEGMNVYL